MNNLLEDIARDIRCANQRLRELRHTKKLLLDMPTEIRELEGFIYPVQTFTNETVLPITAHEGGESLLRALQTIGFIGFKKDCSGYSGEWQATGEAIINDIKVKITILRVDQPPKCHLEEYHEVTTRFRIVCEEDSVDGVVVR